MSELRGELVKENEKINWEPDYIKEGRFGEWLKEVKDWAISRERYWGTPMPIWLNADGSKRIVADSLDTLRKYSRKRGNKYFVMRHGGSHNNVKDVTSFKHEAGDHLTGEGREQARLSAESLKDRKIDLVIASPFTRTKETAEIVAETLGLKEVVFDQRLKEMNPGDYDGKSWFDYHESKTEVKDWFHDSTGGSETYAEALKRVGEALYEIEQQNHDKNIFIVTHGGPAWLAFVAAGYFLPEAEYQEPSRAADTDIFVPRFKRFANAEVRELDFTPLPHNENYELDLHKPYIDEIVLEKDGEDYTRVKEVMDVWLDSGTMPFSQDAEERKNPGDFSNLLYPAEFISEAIDQTRGWFYTMHAVGVLMGQGRAYENVICLGHILDKDGKKMSKSLGNVVSPWEMMDKYGADALRLWMYSVNQPGESKNFDERTVDELNKRLFNILDNVYSFYELYRDRELEADSLELASPSVLDAWILVKLAELTTRMTSKLDEYKLLEPVRDMRDFVDNLSTWYLRRSRDRIKEGDPDAKKTLYFVLRRMAVLLAPFAPFAAEDLYQKLRLDSNPESVHLAAWPEFDKLNIIRAENVVEKMDATRKIVTLALEARSKANIKIRQPLGELRIKDVGLGNEYLALISDEVNVKKIFEVKDLESEVELDITLTPELEEEGRLRDEIRIIQDMRKEKGLKPGELLKISVPEDKADLYRKFESELKKATSVEF